jgi:hypothetical protein
MVVGYKGVTIAIEETDLLTDTNGEIPKVPVMSPFLPSTAYSNMGL